MSKFKHDTVAVLDTHGFLYCRVCSHEYEFDGEYKEFTVTELEKMLGPKAHHHTELCDGCGRVWGLRTGASKHSWVYTHELAPITEADKEDPETFFMDGGVNGEWYIIPYKHRAEWFEWVNAQDGVGDDAPDCCTLVGGLCDVVFHGYRIDRG